jgi:hypothetical protein
LSGHLEALLACEPYHDDKSRQKASFDNFRVVVSRPISRQAKQTERPRERKREREREREEDG